VKALVRTVAAELRRNGAPSLDTASNAWLENRPQSLWPLPDAAVAASMARKRDEGGRPVPLAASASSRIAGDGGDRRAQHLGGAGRQLVSVGRSTNDSG
jgi:hypothetical protein